MFSFEKWLKKNTNCDDPDSWVIIATNEYDGVSISSYDGSYDAEGKNLEEACKNFEALYTE